ncbi:MAG TPA: aldo/keto reductase, partial [Kosmotogaceae bacterium]|nr:aldo/keto reductase [Kosmotogaceae bacterium]
EETVQALSDLQSEGKIRHYGVSHLPINRIREYCERGNPYAVMAEFSAVSTAAKETVFPICRNNALKMIAFSVTGRGILTGSFDRERRFEHGDIRMMDPLFQREKLDCALAISEKMEELSRKIGVTRVQLAIAWVLSHSEVWIALTGPSTISHMMENVQAQRIKLEADLKKEIDEAIREQQNSLRNKQEESVRNLVSSRLPADPSQALSDMVYAVETAIEIGKISEEQVIESVMTLLSMKDKASVRFREELEQLRLLLVKHLG